MTIPKSISPKEVHDRLQAEDDFVLLDIRQPSEIDLACIDDAICIPMGEIPNVYEQLSKEKDIVVICHHGIRSARICEFLRSQGYERAINMTGGTDAWSVEVDPSLPRY